MTPWEVFVAAVAADPAAPRITFYERTPGPTFGERIELSGKVLLNWASKAANLLVEEFNVEPGAIIELDLPACHWRTAYWSLAAWAVGANVRWSETSMGKPDADPADVRIALSGDADILVTLAALARAYDGDVPDGALDEAHDLATFADQFAPVAPADNALPATSQLTGAELAATGPAPRTYLPEPTPELLYAGLVGGGVMLVRGPVDAEALDNLLAQEGLAR